MASNFTALIPQPGAPPLLRLYVGCGQHFRRGQRFHSSRREAVSPPPLPAPRVEKKNPAGPEDLLFFISKPLVSLVVDLTAWGQFPWYLVKVSVLPESTCLNRF